MSKNSQSTISTSYSRMGKNGHPVNPDDTSVESETPHKSVPKPQTSDPAPIPLSEYSSLDDETALLELERCKKRSNYNGDCTSPKSSKKKGSQ